LKDFAARHFVQTSILSFSLLDQLQGILDTLPTTQYSVLTLNYTGVSVSARSVVYIAAVHSCVASVKADHGVSDSVFSYPGFTQTKVASGFCLPAHESRENPSLAMDLLPNRAYDMHA
jgi:hypothetical protein